jgi:DGQHR domain-containing protein
MPNLQFSYPAISAQQSDAGRVFSFAASAAEILQFASIERVGRTAEGKLTGFQRPQVTSHIAEIQDYLAQPEAVLPNSIVVAFTRGVEVVSQDKGRAVLKILCDDGPPGYVVDGQQRLTALSKLPQKNFEVFVSAILCDSYEELRRQFILINSTRPLSKSLIHELLPSVDGLPDRLASRSLAAAMTEALNHRPDSSLRGQIQQHSTPKGVISDTAIQRVVMNSLSDGVLRDLRVSPTRLEPGFHMLSEYFGAVQDRFPKAWVNQKPTTSRLIHSAGIIAMGYVMEALHSRHGATTREEFRKRLAPLVDRAAWTEGSWHFADDEVVPWNALQNVPRHVSKLSHFLVAASKPRSKSARAA